MVRASFTETSTGVTYTYREVFAGEGDRVLNRQTTPHAQPHVQPHAQLIAQRRMGAQPHAQPHAQLITQRRMGAQPHAQPHEVIRKQCQFYIMFMYVMEYCDVFTNERCNSILRVFIE